MNLRSLCFLVLLSGRVAAQDTSRIAQAPGVPWPRLTWLTHPARFRDLDGLEADSARALRTALNEFYDRCTEAAGMGEPIVDAVGQEGEYWVVHVATGHEVHDGDMLVWVHKTSAKVSKVKRWCS
jgi:hypothetical protein